MAIPTFFFFFVNSGGRRSLIPLRGRPEGNASSPMDGTFTHYWCSIRVAGGYPSRNGCIGTLLRWQRKPHKTCRGYRYLIYRSQWLVWLLNEYNTGWVLFIIDGMPCRWFTELKWYTSAMSTQQKRILSLVVCSLVPRPTLQGGRVWEITLLGAVQLECHGFWIQQTSSFRSSTRLVLYYSNFQYFYVLPYICFLSLVELERWLAGLTFFPSSTHAAAFRPSRHFRA